MYSFDSRVRYSETDEKGRLSVTGIINYLQDCSTFQSEDLGLGIEYLNRNHRAWWLSSWQIVIERQPKLGEQIVISTWPYDFKGMYGYRNFTIRDKDGEFLVKANSIWFFFDTEAGRPVKVLEKDIRGYGTGEEKKLEMDYAPRRIAVPKECERMEPIIVGKHHIDTNHHVNNAQYVEMAREVLPNHLEVSEVRVEYKKAAVLGDSVMPHVSRTEDGYVVALCDTQDTPYAVIGLRGQA
ncbi:acyl-[acyl-carrier-protein] thioesterase [Clostridium sp. MCC353]|uniref:acyl-[acyl-carrier-protein] thioesterase n=1 Tax=Clostridium sp. MCC353 TaxID=2592646 RepID=UPI001C01754D|nr:acyl-ACP thioesterase domain-containing protein [Clostridium sp. MCC353]MBT9775745.1 acyl-[acyl-carrier-protein] thioesterase [Clostridium sp. MCC353]